MVEIKYVGFDELNLDQFQRKEIDSLVERQAGKIQRMVNNELELVIHVKAYEKAGDRQKHSLHLRATWPGETMVADKVHDWNVLTGLQNAFAALEAQISKKYRL